MVWGGESDRQKLGLLGNSDFNPVRVELIVHLFLKKAFFLLFFSINMCNQTMLKYSFLPGMFI